MVEVERVEAKVAVVMAVVRVAGVREAAMGEAATAAEKVGGAEEVARAVVE
jgi:hypothetical protein